ncbi:MAG: transporter [Bacteroidales bacterium]|nr:transporter [Bacteroidales bacterium]
MQKYRSYVLPVAILLGFLFHSFSASIAFLVPWLLFAILLLNFVTVDLRHLRFSMLHFWLILFQLTVSVGLYQLVRAVSGNETMAQGFMMCALCPVAASVVVISSMLGADRMTTTTYTMFCNLVMSVAAPLTFTVIGVHPELTFWQSFLMILRRITPTLALPFFTALALQLWVPKANNWLCRYKNVSFYLWACALFMTLGRTIDYIFLQGRGNERVILFGAVFSAVMCAVQFGFGKWLGHRYGDTVAGGQLLGQKNTAMGIWMANTYLQPLSSVFLAFYIIWQNLFNSLQLWWHDRRVSS